MPGNPEFFNNSSFLMVFSASQAFHSIWAALACFRYSLGFNFVAFSRNSNISSLVLVKTGSRSFFQSFFVGKRIESVKSSCHGSKVLSTGGGTKILIEIELKVKRGEVTCRRRMSTARTIVDETPNRCLWCRA